MIWADRAAIVCYVLMELILTIAIHGSTAEYGTFSRWLYSLWVGVLMVGIFIWIPRRVVDFALGGPMRRGRR